MHRLIAAFLLLALPAMASAQEYFLQETEMDAMQRRLARKEQDLEYIGGLIEKAKAKGDRDQVTRLENDYEEVWREVKRLRFQISQGGGVPPRTLDYVASMDGLHMGMYWIGFRTPHSLGIGHYLGFDHDEPGPGLNGGFGYNIQLREAPVMLTFRRLYSVDQESNERVEIREYMIGLSVLQLLNTQPTHGGPAEFQILASGGIINLSSGSDGPATDSGTILSLEFRLRMGVSSRSNLVAGWAFDTLWTDFNHGHTRKYFAQGFEMGYELKF